MSTIHRADRPLDTPPLEPIGRPIGYWTRRFEVALTALIVLAVTIWMVSK